MRHLIATLEIGSDVLLKILEDLMEGETSPEWTQRWKAIEDRATMLLSYEHSVVPRLLQTPEYATAVIWQGQPQADVSAKVSARLERQATLRKEDAPTAVFVMNERVLFNRVDGPATMREQMLALIELSKLPNVIIQIVEDADGYHPGRPVRS